MVATVSADNGSVSGSAGIKLSSDSSGVLALQSGANTTAVTIDTSQNVGIGTTSPSAPLHVRVATDANLRVVSSSGTLNLSAENNAGSAQVAMKFNGSQMMLDSSGNLLVGTTTNNWSSTIRLAVSGSKGASVQSTGGAGNEALAVWNNATSGTRYQVYFGDGTNGDVRGSITTNGANTAYNTSSDYRLKEDIAPMTGALAKVLQLKPCTYKWKENGEEGEGFIAHELAEVKPHAVVGEKDAVDENGKIVPQGIDTSFLVATLTAAIQEQQALITAQAETINALTARVVALEGQ